MKITYLIYFLFATRLIAQDFHIVPNNPIEVALKLEGLDVFNHYEFESYHYYLGKNIHNEEIDYGMYLLVYNKAGEKIYHSPTFNDSNTHDLTFFKSITNPKITIIFGYLSNEGSWGNLVYILENGEIRKIGNLDISTWELGDDMTGNIATKTEIKKENNDIIFTFKADSVNYDSMGRNDQLFRGKEIYYLYNNKEFKLIKNSR